jgi:flagellar basal-body rod modification protein FlgD
MLNPIQAADPTASTKPNLGGISSQKDQFLKLLLAQLEHQDPTSPQDPSQFVQQMTQFGQLEQLFNLNDAVKNQSNMQANNQGMQAVNLIGKNVQAEGNLMDVKSGKGVLAYELSDPAKEIQIDIKNEAGQTVRTLSDADKGTGIYNLSFDGKDSQGQALPDGTYKFAVSALDENNKVVGSKTIMQGKVDAVDYSGGQVLLRVGNRTVTMENIISVSG